jgi:hypothetical protein
VSFEPIWQWRRRNVYLPLLTCIELVFLYKSHTPNLNINCYPSMKSTVIGIWRRKYWYVGAILLDKHSLSWRCRQQFIQNVLPNYAHPKRPAVKLWPLHAFVQITCEIIWEMWALHNIFGSLGLLLPLDFVFLMLTFPFESFGKGGTRRKGTTWKTCTKMGG